MLLSIIIPFYNVEAYIGACLERVSRLPQEICEVLLVDDCGQDRSAEIAAEYCQKYPHFHIIQREKNGGLSAARNTGMAQARGEYLYFLDSDDLPEPHALLTLASAARDQQLDVAKARFCYYDDETGARAPVPCCRPWALCREPISLPRSAAAACMSPWSGNAFSAGLFFLRPAWPCPKGSCLRTSCFRPPRF